VGDPGALVLGRLQHPAEQAPALVCTVTSRVSPWVRATISRNITMLPAATTGTSMGRPLDHSSICTAGARMAAAPRGTSRQRGRRDATGGSGTVTSAIEGWRAAAPQASANRL